MFHESKVVDYVAVVFVAFIGAYLHYRIRRRRMETRLAVGMMDHHDTLLADALAELSGRGVVTRLEKRTYTVTKRSGAAARALEAIDQPLL